LPCGDRRTCDRTPFPVTFQQSGFDGRRPHATTILGVKRNGAVALAGDGQVTVGDIVLKHGARKIRLMHDGQILVGFAGAVADALTLFGKFEVQLKAWDGNLRRASVELAKEWRTDRYLRRLEAQLIVADAQSLLVLSGDGDVIEPDDGVVAIGSGAPYATAAAKALVEHTELDARAIVEAAMRIAADICIFTNDHFTVESIEAEMDGEETGDVASVDDVPVNDTLPASEASTEDDDEDDEDEEAEAVEEDAFDGDEDDGEEERD
jgi:ATP-dependent HslUV protease subunit HslV